MKLLCSLAAPSARGNVMSEHIIEVDINNFSSVVEASEQLVLIDFWAPWCAPCKALNPIISELADKFAGNVKVAKVNIDEARELGQQFGVRGIPALFLFKDGKMTQNISNIRSLSGLVDVLEGQIGGQSIEDTMLKRLDDPEMLSMFLQEADINTVRTVLTKKPEIATTPIGEYNTLPMTMMVQEKQLERVALLREFGAKPTLVELIMLGLIDELTAEVSGLSSQQVLEKAQTPAAEFYATVLMTNNWQLCELLIPENADLNLPGENNDYPILQCALRLSVEKLSLLVNRGLDLSAIMRGKNSLQMAIANLDTVKFLLANGQDPKKTDSEGRTAVEYAKQAAEINPACQSVADYLAAL